MEPIDAAYDNFVSLTGQISTYLDSIITEADTRLKVIDPVLGDVLRWPLCAINAELSTGSGFIDYACSVEGRSRLIVEAKRDSKSLGCASRLPGRGYKLNGGAFTSPAAKEGIAQAIRYSGEMNTELACVTNGREWIVFRGSRLGDGLDTREGMAFIFADLDVVASQFALFYNLLSYESAVTRSYRPHFHEVEGQPIRTTMFNKAIRPQGSAKLQRRSALSSDVGILMARFFDRLTGDEDDGLLEACFVETRESQYADRQLARISEDLVQTIRDLETEDAGELTKLIQRVTEARRHEFVVIVGTKGAGKSTFITRFFRSVLPAETAKKLIVIKVDLKGSTGNSSSIVTWLDDVLVGQAERAAFPDGPPTYDQLRGIFFHEYSRLRVGAWANQYKTDREGFRQKFGAWIEEARQNKPHDYIEGLLRFVISSERKVPIVIFDNADHYDIDFQQSVYQYARSLYEETVCLIMLPITDRTSWALSKHGALQSFDHQSFFLPTPSTDRIIRKRIEFLESRIAAEREKPERYFIQRGIHLAIGDIANFARTLQRVFLQTSGISSIIGDLANHDVRRALNLTREFSVSPHLRIEDLIKSYIADTSVDVPLYVAVRALVRSDYDIYPGQHNYVQNIFALNADLTTTPLLCARILQMLSDVPVDDRNGALVHVDFVMTHLSDAGIEPRAISLWLDAMLKTGLCLSYDRTVQQIEDTTQIEISPSGRQHLRWALGHYEYIGAMADVTPLLNESMYQVMVDEGRNNRTWRKKTASFLEYLISEDEMYCTLPIHPSYQGQVRLTKTIDGVARRLRQEVINRSSAEDRKVPPQRSSRETASAEAPIEGASS